MKYNISKDTLKETTQCSRDYSCLEGKKDCLCAVKEKMDSNIFFIKPGNIPCPYSMTFGYSHICNCPTRKEIYNRYRE